MHMPEMVVSRVSSFPTTGKGNNDSENEIATHQVYHKCFFGLIWAVSVGLMDALDAGSSEFEFEPWPGLIQGRCQEFFKGCHTMPK